MRMNRPTEFGSFFHLDPAVPLGGARWLQGGDVLVGSGRDALRAIVAQGRWRRLHAPSYYCHAVLDDVAGDIEVCLYPHTPFCGATHLAVGDDEAAIVPEYFGLRAEVTVAGGSVLLDRTHDLLATWTYDRQPDFIFASLRKTLPVPEGGVVRGLPAGVAYPPTSMHLRAAACMSAAMAMKAAYLAGATVDKAAYLALGHEGESGLRRDAEVSGASTLTQALAPAIDLHRLQQRRHENLARLGGSLAGLPASVQWVQTPAYGILLCADEALRERVRQRLIAAQVYPAVLWPMTWPGVPDHSRRLSGRILVVHADHRYGARDIEQLAGIILQATAIPDEA